jgi:hypothetical protein|nr:MAG: hypothetical protein KatS3mg041_1222 [Bacteroidota bacterium]
MAQTQLLALVLGVLIVGLAIVLGIEVFHRQERQHRRDRAYLFCMETATKARAYYRMPRSLGGGEFSFEGFDFTKIGLAPSQNPLLYEDPEGTRYELQPEGRERLRLVASYREPGGIVYLAVCLIEPDTMYLYRSFAEAQAEELPR